MTRGPRYISGYISGWNDVRDLRLKPNIDKKFKRAKVYTEMTLRRPNPNPNPNPRSIPR